MDRIGSIRVTLAKLLHEERLKQEMSQTQLSQLSGVSRGTIIDLERGRQNPRIETLLQLSEGLDMDLPKLLRKAIRKNP